VFDAFFRDNMAQFVDTSRSQWQWKPGAAAGPASLLQQLQRAQRIRSIFFGAAGQGPQANFTLAADTLDAAVLHVSVDVDGQSFDYQSGTSKSINWPGASGEASYGFATSSGQLGGGSWRGPWSWFRLLEQAQVEAGADGRYRITLHAGGKSARLLLDAGSVRNPFARNEIAGFRCAM
jgi:type VI secretion system protein ImpL